MGDSYIDLDYRDFRRVKLVIGNGFDIACGLHSSYGEFFATCAKEYDQMRAWSLGKEWPSNMTTWDYIFCLVQKEYTKFQNVSSVKWKDVEAMIRLALGFELTGYSPLSFSLAHILVADDSALTEDEHKIKDQFQMNHKIAEPRQYYKDLLDELLSFETRFSAFIQKRMKENRYQEKAKRLLFDGLKMKGRMVSIDTFNYTTPKIFDDYRFYDDVDKETYPIAVRHINGKIGGAIFGIDSHHISVDDPRYIFTKSYRKMRRLVDGEREDYHRRFSNIVVYGHSLAEADYSYFFSMMDSLNLSNYHQVQSRLIFAFSHYSDEAEEELTWSVLHLLEAYDKWKNPNSIRNGLTECVETSDRIGFAKIDTEELFKDLK